MNEMIYLTFKDVDPLILSHLDPPDILLLSEVNKHYLNALDKDRQIVNCIKYNFFDACENGHKSIAEWLLSLEETHGKIDIHVDDEKVFRHACSNGHKAVAEWLLSLEETHGKINIHANDDQAFRLACRRGHKSVSEWLLSLEETHGKIDK